jgi:hypothetical protein
MDFLVHFSLVFMHGWLILDLFEGKMAHIVWMHWVSRCIRMDTIIESLAGLPTSKISLLHFTNISICCHKAMSFRLDIILERMCMLRLSMGSVIV